MRVMRERFTKSKNLMQYQRSFDSVFLSFVEKNSAQDDMMNFISDSMSIVNFPIFLQLFWI